MSKLTNILLLCTLIHLLLYSLIPTISSSLTLFDFQAAEMASSSASSTFMSCSSGSIEDCLTEDIGNAGDFDMESETTRRILAYRRRYISYGALSRNRVPCSRRGASYYNCRPGAAANPYTRGCSAITRCRR